MHVGYPPTKVLPLALAPVHVGGLIHAPCYGALVPPAAMPVGSIVVHSPRTMGDASRPGFSIPATPVMPQREISIPAPQNGNMKISAAGSQSAGTVQRILSGAPLFTGGCPGGSFVISPRASIAVAPPQNHQTTSVSPQAVLASSPRHSPRDSIAVSPRQTLRAVASQSPHDTIAVPALVMPQREISIPSSRGGSMKIAAAGSQTPGAVERLLSGGLLSTGGSPGGSLVISPRASINVATQQNLQTASVSSQTVLADSPRQTPRAARAPIAVSPRQSLRAVASQSPQYPIGGPPPQVITTSPMQSYCISNVPSEIAVIYSPRQSQRGTFVVTSSVLGGTGVPSETMTAASPRQSMRLCSSTSAEAAASPPAAPSLSSPNECAMVAQCGEAQAGTTAGNGSIDVMENAASYRSSSSGCADDTSPALDDVAELCEGSSANGKRGSIRTNLRETPSAYADLVQVQTTHRRVSLLAQPRAYQMTKAKKDFDPVFKGGSAGAIYAGHRQMVSSVAGSSHFSSPPLDVSKAEKSARRGSDATAVRADPSTYARVVDNSARRRLSLMATPRAHNSRSKVVSKSRPALKVGIRGALYHEGPAVTKAPEHKRKEHKRKGANVKDDIMSLQR